MGKYSRACLYIHKELRLVSILKMSKKIHKMTSFFMKFIGANEIIVIMHLEFSETNPRYLVFSAFQLIDASLAYILQIPLWDAYSVGGYLGKSILIWVLKLYLREQTRIPAATKKLSCSTSRTS